MTKKLTRGLVVGVTLAALAAPSAALAATATATGSVTGSTFSLNVPALANPTFTANIDLGDQTPTYTVPMTVQDTRGTGAGWNLTITSTAFTTGTQSLANAASSMTSLTSVPGTGTNTNPTNAISYPLAVPAAASAPTAVKFFNAAANSGMGKFTITPTITVTVPQNSFTGTYSSTLTIANVSGP